MLHRFRLHPGGAASRNDAQATDLTLAGAIFRIFNHVTRDIPGECPDAEVIFLSVDFSPTGNTLTITNESVENLKALDYIFSIRKTLIKKSKTCGPPPILGLTVVASFHQFKKSSWLGGVFCPKTKTPI